MSGITGDKPILVAEVITRLSGEVKDILNNPQIGDEDKITLLNQLKTRMLIEHNDNGEVVQDIANRIEAAIRQCREGPAAATGEAPQGGNDGAQCALKVIGNNTPANPSPKKGPGKPATKDKAAPEPDLQVVENPESLDELLETQEEYDTPRGIIDALETKELCLEEAMIAVLEQLAKTQERLAKTQERLAECEEKLKFTLSETEEMADDEASDDEEFFGGLFKNFPAIEVEIKNILEESCAGDAQSDCPEPATERQINCLIYSAMILEHGGDFRGKKTYAPEFKAKYPEYSGFLTTATKEAAGPLVAKMKEVVRHFA